MSNWEDVKQRLGSQVERHFRKKKIVLTDTTCGSFKASDISVLKECQIIQENTKKHVKFTTNKYVKRRCNSVPRRPAKRHQTGVKHNDKKGTEQTEQKINSIEVVDVLSLNVFLANTSENIRSRGIVHPLPKSHILNTATFGTQICKKILKTDVGGKIYNCPHSNAALASLLQGFQKQHKQFNYFPVLKNILTRYRKRYKKENWKHGVPLIDEYFSLLISKVVPLPIFGGNKNRQYIYAGLHNLLLTSEFENLSLKPVVRQLDLSKIEWLQLVEDSKLQYIMIAKLVKWFFQHYLIKILRNFFHIANSPADRFRKMFIISTVWQSMQKKYVKQIERAEIIKPVTKQKDWNPPTGVYKLRPKYSKVRPLLQVSYEDNEKPNMLILKEFLKQLHVTTYGMSSEILLYKQWREICTQKPNNPHENFSFVSCDISDAFGSVILDKLYIIIESLCDSLPNVLTLDWYKVLSRNPSYRWPIRNIQCFSEKDLELAFPPDTLHTKHPTQRSKLIQKSWILYRLKQHIFSQTVKINFTKYTIVKGLPQGSSLSSVLCSIYYSFMIRENLSHFDKTGVMLRYMDDILYVTTDISSAHKFYQLTKDGVQNYNCQFQKLKTQTNVSFSNHENKNVVSDIRYIGYSINCDTLEIRPNYGGVHPRYSISYFNAHKTDSFSVFEKKVYNIAILKLSRLVLSQVINSLDTIKQILKDASLFQARRTMRLIFALFDNIENYVEKIYLVINKSNRKILSTIMRYNCLENPSWVKSAGQKWCVVIMQTFWTSYYKVFKQHHILGPFFRDLFIQQIIKLQ